MTSDDHCEDVPENNGAEADSGAAKGPAGEAAAGQPGRRARKLGSRDKETFAKLISRGWTVAEAAGFVGCGRKTIYRERERDPHFDAEVRRAKELVGRNLKDVIVTASRTSWRAAAWLMNFTDEVRFREQKARLQERVREAREEPPKEPRIVVDESEMTWYGLPMKTEPKREPRKARKTRKQTKE